MPTRSKLALISALLVCFVVGQAVRGDYVVLKDGTVLEGTVLKRGSDYWVKDKDGTSRTVKPDEVKETGKGAYKGAAGAKAPAAGTKPKTGAKATAGPKADDSAKPAGAAGATKKKPVDFATCERKAKQVDVAMKAVIIWQEFLDSKPADKAERAKAKKELDAWQKLADGGGEKIKGKWISGPERQAIVDKAQDLYREGAVLMAGEQTLLALEKLKESVGIYPNNFHANFTLGFLLTFQDKHPEARKHFEAAHKIRPDSPETLSNLAVLEMEKKQHVKAIEMFYKAAQKGDNKDIVQNLMCAIMGAPRGVMNNQKLKPAIEAAKLLAARHGVAGANRLVFVGLSEDEQKSGGEGEQAATGMSSGTGFLISPDGLILTNRHVVEDGKSFLVLINGKDKRTAEVVVIDNEQDLALIRVKPDDNQQLPFVQLSDADRPGDGAVCTVMGYPLIDRLGASIKITNGIVTSGEAKVPGGPDVMVSATVNPGNSGGPVMDKYGNVMAIVSMKTIATATEDTYGLAISAGNVRKFLAKNKVEVTAAVSAGAAVLDAEQIAAKVKPATVCIIASH